MITITVTDNKHNTFSKTKIKHLFSCSSQMKTKVSLNSKERPYARQWIISSSSRGSKWIGALRWFSRTGTTRTAADYGEVSFHSVGMSIFIVAPSFVCEHKMCSLHSMKILWKFPWLCWLLMSFVVVVTCEHLHAPLCVHQRFKLHAAKNGLINCRDSLIALLFLRISKRFHVSFAAVTRVSTSLTVVSCQSSLCHPLKWNDHQNQISQKFTLQSIEACCWSMERLNHSFTFKRHIHRHWEFNRAFV